MVWKVNYSPYKYRILSIVIFLLFFTNIGFGQENDNIVSYQESTLKKGKFTEEDRANFTQNFKYGKLANEKNNQSQDGKINNLTNSIEPNIWSSFFMGNWSNLSVGNWMQILGIILLVFCVTIWLLFFSQRYITTQNREANNERISYEFEGEDIQDFNAKVALNASLREEDYRISIRINFLEILQKLSNHGYIKWGKDKGSGVYVSELRKTAPNYVDNFKEVAYIFDYIWYSNEAIAKEQYQVAVPYFSNFLGSIN